MTYPTPPDAAHCALGVISIALQLLGAMRYVSTSRAHPVESERIAAGECFLSLGGRFGGRSFPSLRTAGPNPRSGVEMMLVCQPAPKALALAGMLPCDVSSIEIVPRRGDGWALIIACHRDGIQRRWLAMSPLALTETLVGGQLDLAEQKLSEVAA